MTERILNAKENDCFERQMSRIADHYLGVDGKKPADHMELQKLNLARIALRAQVMENTLRPKDAREAVEAMGQAATTTYNEYQFCVRGNAHLSAPPLPKLPKPAALGVSAASR